MDARADAVLTGDDLIGEDRLRVGRRWRRPLVIGLKLVASAVIVALLVWQATASGQWGTLWQGPKRWSFFVFACAASLLAHLIGFVRWYVMGRAVGLEIPLRESVRMGLIGNMFSLVSVGTVGGDGVRAWFAARQSPGRRPEAVASVLLDRVVGMLTMFLVAAIGYATCRSWFIAARDQAGLRAVEWTCWGCGAIAVVGLAGLGLLMQLTRFRHTAWYRWIESLPLVGWWFHRASQILSLYRGRPGIVLASLLLSLLVNFLFALSLWSVGEFLPGQPPKLDQHLVIAPIAMVANCAPLPGGIGGMEAAVGLLYGILQKPALGPQAPGVVVAFVYRITLLVVAVLGVVAWFMAPGKLREELQHAEAEAVDL